MLRNVSLMHTRMTSQVRQGPTVVPVLRTGLHPHPIPRGMSPQAETCSLSELLWQHIPIKSYFAQSLEFACELQCD